MRTLIDLGEGQVRALDEVAKTEKKSRAAVIREAIDHFLIRRRADDQQEAFGLWGKNKVDGLEYEQDLRREW